MMLVNSWRSVRTVFLTTLLSVVLAGGIGFGLYFSWDLEQQVANQVPYTICLPSAQLPPTCYARPLQLTSDPAAAIAVNSEGTLLASSSQRTIRLWDMSTGRLVRSLQAHTDWITALAFNPDGQTLASSSMDQTIKLWNLATGEVERSLPAGRITALAFSPEGQVLAGGSRLARWHDGSLPLQGVHRWEVATGRSLPVLGSESVSTLAFSPNGKFLATGAKTTQLWDLQTEQLHHTLGSGTVTALVFSPDGQTLFTGGSKTRSWQISSGTLLQIFKVSASELLLSPNGKILVAASGGTIKFWELEANRLLGSLRGSFYSSLELNFGLKGGVLIGSSSDGIKLWQRTADTTAAREQQP